jgi:hypothetical protein
VHVEDSMRVCDTTQGDNARYVGLVNLVRRCRITVHASPQRQVAVQQTWHVSMYTTVPQVSDEPSKLASRLSIPQREFFRAAVRHNCTRLQAGRPFRLQRVAKLGALHWGCRVLVASVNQQSH